MGDPGARPRPAPGYRVRRLPLGWIIETFPVGPLECNCTILGDPVSKKAIVVDPGGSIAEIQARLARHGLTCTALLHTHAHLDHILATRAMKEATGASIHLHQGDVPLYEGLSMQTEAMARWGLPMARPDAPLPVDSYLKDGDAITAGGLEVQVLHTPGHTPGSCCFNVPDRERKVLLSGDTLFEGNVGRTDLWGGDDRQIVKSIRERLFKLDDATLVVPGHNECTTIGHEKMYNPFVRP